DGWWHFPKAMRQVFESTAKSAGLHLYNFNFVADLFHLQRDLQKAAHTARKVIESAAARDMRAREKALAALRARVENAVASSQGRKEYRRLLRLKDQQQSLKAHREFLILDTSKVQYLEAAFER